MAVLVSKRLLWLSRTALSQSCVQEQDVRLCYGAMAIQAINEQTWIQCGDIYRLHAGVNIVCFESLFERQKQTVALPVLDAGVNEPGQLNGFAWSIPHKLPSRWAKWNLFFLKRTLWQTLAGPSILTKSVQLLYFLSVFGVTQRLSTWMPSQLSVSDCLIRKVLHFRSAAFELAGQHKNSWGSH